jgi:hypothetical protein
VLKPINEHKSSFSGCIKPNVWTQQVMAERMVIGYLVNTFKVFGNGFCLERGWFTLIHRKKKKKTVCVWHAHQDDVIEKQLKLNPALKKLATHVGSMNSFPRLLDRLKSLKEPIHDHQWQTDRKIYAQWGGGNSVIRVLAGTHHWLTFHEHPVDRYIYAYHIDDLKAPTTAAPSNPGVYM